MKRGTPEHPKLDALARRLGIPHAHAGGLLEFLWHWTMRYAPAGDIGRWTNAAIAKGAGWTGDAEEFVSALIDERWADTHEVHRVVIHDWPAHADDSVHLSLARATVFFCDGSVPRTTRMSRKEQTRVRACYSKVCNTHAQSTHEVRTQNALSNAPRHAPPSPPIPSHPLPSHQQQQQGPDAAAAVAGVGVLTAEQERNYATLYTRPTWVGEDGPWIDASTARRLARMPSTTAAMIDHVMKDAKASRRNLKNPAGLVIKNLSNPDRELVAAIAARAAAESERA